MVERSHATLHPDQRHKRTKTGCRTCRIRRVKCDETRPNCKRCTDTGRSCDGYVQPAEPPPVAVITIPRQLSPICRHYDSRSAYQFFQDVTAPALVNFGSHYFWNKLVLQVCTQDESIKHLVIAASVLDRKQRSVSQQSEHPAVFSFHYSRALQLLSQSTHPDTGVILIACLLFVICDELQDNQFAALQHILAGRNILNDYCEQRTKTQYSTTVEELGPIFYRLQLQVGELDQETMPYHTRYIADGEESPPSFAYDPDPPNFSVRPSSVFQGYQDVGMASTCLQRLAPMCLAPREGTRPASRFHIVSDVTTQLNQWVSYFNYRCAQLNGKEAARQRSTIHLLRVYHMCLNIISRCAPFNNETAYDQFLGNFEHILVKTTFLLRDPDVPHMGERLICPLFFIAAHYRDVAYRRRAWIGLQKCGWEGMRLATVAEQIIRLEERGCEEPIVSADIPEKNRIRVLGILFDDPEDSADDGEVVGCKLMYTKHPYGESSATKEHCFAWNGMRDKAVQESVVKLLQRVLKFEFVTSAAGHPLFSARIC